MLRIPFASRPQLKIFPFYNLKIFFPGCDRTHSLCRIICASIASGGAGMSITETESAFVIGAGKTVSLSSMVSVTASSANPTYLILTTLDRDEYTAAATGATGSLSGNGHTLSMSAQDSDARGSDIVFTYQASSGRYYNATYGYLDQVTYTAPSSTNDVADLALFATNSVSVANGSSSTLTAYNLTQSAQATLLASATVVAAPVVAESSVPSQATPDSICSTALSFVGKAWNMDGCWVLASTIAAEAGAALPVGSSLVGVTEKSLGEWFIAYDGPAGQSGNWQSMVTAGEMVAFSNGSSGHITTVVSGSGSSAMLVDNITYETYSGTITNSAHDGSADDVTISAPHAASQEFSGLSSSTVVIYELDTPIVTALKSSAKLAIGTKDALSTLVSAADPAGKSVAEYQVYDSLASDSFTVNGTTEHASSASAAITVTSLAAVSLAAGSATGTDTLEVRAYNGSYWGDWTSVSVAVSTTVTASPPVVAQQTTSQTWTQGEHVQFTLASGTFSDPNGETLTYSATQSNGSALPSWLTFNAATDSFSGTVPSGAASLSLTVTATDTSKLSVKDTFAVAIAQQTTTSANATGPVLAHQTANQSWALGQMVDLQLPSNIFSDPGATLTYTATELSGPSLLGWISFNPHTLTLSGIAPMFTSGTARIEITATDQAGHSAYDIFTVAIGGQNTLSSSFAHGLVL
jgi:hypothetical protein